MPRIAGINIPEQEKIDLSLTRIYGIGPGNVGEILEKAGVSAQKRARDLKEEEVAALNQVVSQIKIEGDLRSEVNANIERLKRIGCYRGSDILLTSLFGGNGQEPTRVPKGASG